MRGTLLPFSIMPLRGCSPAEWKVEKHSAGLFLEAPEGIYRASKPSIGDSFSVAKETVKLRYHVYAARAHSISKGALSFALEILNKLLGNLDSQFGRILPETPHNFLTQSIRSPP